MNLLIKPKLKLIYITTLFFLFFVCASGNSADKKTKKEVAEMKISSPAFENGKRIPVKYTCDGEDISPPLQWSGAPEGTKSFVLIVDDPDAPYGTFTHWVVYDIPASLTSLPENFKKDREVGGIKQGVNDFGRVGWGGPCPPRGHGTHRYFFRLKALSVPSLGLPPGAQKSEVLKAIEGKVIAEAEFYGTYSR